MYRHERREERKGEGRGVDKESIQNFDGKS
jgi:hypothetical protein